MNKQGGKMERRSTPEKRDAVFRSGKASAESYEGFNEDLIQIVALHGELPWGATKALTELAGYAKSSNISRHVKWVRATSQDGDTEKQQPKKPSIRALLGKPSEDVVRFLGLGGDEKATAALCRCTNRHELEQSYERFFRGAPEPIPLVAWGCDNAAAVGPSIDIDQLKQFFDSNIEGRSEPIAITIAPHVGASHALHALQPLFGIRRRLVHVTPPLGNGVVAEASILQGLADFLGLAGGEGVEYDLRLPRVIVDWARGNNVCVVIHNAHLVRGQGSRKLLALLQEAIQTVREIRRQEKQRSEKDDHERDSAGEGCDLPNLLVHYPSGQDPSALSMSRARVIIASYMPEGIGQETQHNKPLDAETRRVVERDLLAMIEYVSQKDIDGGHRGLAHMLQSPSRVRVRRQMERMLRAGLKPNRTSLLIRAAAIADKRILVPDDPTLGLRHLVGADVEGRFPEFTRLRNDVLSSIHGISKEHLRALRMISTSIHWITRDMLDELARSADNRAIDNYYNWANVEGLIEMPNFALASMYLASDGDDGNRARAPIAVKAVIQDHWRAVDPITYVAVHVALARSLLDLAKMPDAKAQQRFAIEYHFAEPPDGPRSVFALEAVRYAGRAFDVISGPDPTARYSFSQEERKAYTRVCKDLVHHALEILGFDLRSDAVRPRRSNHVLSRQYGRYHSKLELFHMLSEANLGNRPSDLLPNSLHEEFFREVGIARFGILDLEGSMRALTDGARDEMLSPAIRMDCMLHGASVAAAAHSFSASKSLTDAAERLIYFCEPDEAKGLLQRIWVRRGLVAREQGDLERAREVFEEVLNRGEPIPVKGDRAIACIDLLIDLGRTQPEVYEDAMMLAQLNSNDLHRQTLFYEAARFDIRSAQILARKGLPMSGEALLDDIGIQLLANGGSPRLHLEFMLASAEVLLYQNAFEWAYAAYVSPGFDLSMEQRHHSYLVQFARLGELCLSAMQQRVTRWLFEGTQDHRARILSLLRREGGAIGQIVTSAWPSAARHSLLRNQYRKFRDAPYDPQHGFDLELPFDRQEEWAERLADPEFVEMELTRCAREAASPQDTHIFARF